MVHLPNTVPQFPRMVRAIRFPGPTLRAPLGPPVTLTHKNILAVEALESWAVRVLIRWVVRSRLDVVLLLRLPPVAGLVALIALRLLLLSLSVFGPWHGAGARLRGVKDAKVGGEGKGEEDGVEDDEGNCEAAVAAGVDKVVNWEVVSGFELRTLRTKLGMWRTAEMDDDGPGAEREGSEDNEGDDHSRPSCRRVVALDTAGRHGDMVITECRL